MGNYITFLKRAGGLFFLCLIFSLAIACHHKDNAINPPIQGENPALRRIAIIPFQQIHPEEDNNKTVRCPLCGTVFLTSKSPGDMGKVVESIFVQRLGKLGEFTLIPSEKVNGVYRQISAESFKTPLPEILKKVGAELEVDGIVVGYVYRYRERKGVSYSVEKPASVAFDIHLVMVNDGTLRWKGSFDRTQSSLLENIFLISSFYKHRGKWATAEELTKEGMEKILKDFPLGR